MYTCVWFTFASCPLDVSTAHSVALAAANNTDINLPLSPHTSPTTQHTLTASQGTTDSYSHQLSEEGFDPATVKYKPGRLSQTTPPQPVVSHNSAYVTGTTVTTTPVLLTAGTHPGGGTQGSDVGSMGGSDWKKGISQVNFLCMLVILYVCVCVCGCVCKVMPILL